MKKKVLASMLALAAVATTATPAFAADQGCTGGHDYADTVTWETGDGSSYGVKYQTINQDYVAAGDKAETEVIVHGGESTFSVKLPKTMDGKADSNRHIEWEYNVYVTGDIAGNETVTVTPEATFDLKQAGKPDITATVTQTINEFMPLDYDLVKNTLSNNQKVMSAAITDVTTNGTVEASGITAGTWKGTFNFNIALNSN